MTGTVVKVSNSQLSKNPDYKVLVEEILGSNSQVVRLNTGAPGTIQYWDGTTTSSVTGEVTVNAGQSWVEALWVGDSILSNTSAMLALVDDGTSHAAALRQPVQEGGSLSINNLPAVQSVSGQVFANQNGAPWQFRNQTITTEIQSVISNLSATPQDVMAANSARRSAYIQLISAVSSAHFSCGGTPTTNSPFISARGQVYVVPDGYAGKVTARALTGSTTTVMAVELT